jgi:hypothetical protein
MCHWVEKFRRRPPQQQFWNRSAGDRSSSNSSSLVRQIRNCAWKLRSFTSKIHSWSRITAKLTQSLIKRSICQTARIRQDRKILFSLPRRLGFRTVCCLGAGPMQSLVIFWCFTMITLSVRYALQRWDRPRSDNWKFTHVPLTTGVCTSFLRCCQREALRYGIWGNRWLVGVTVNLHLESNRGYRARGT